LQGVVIGRRLQAGRIVPQRGGDHVDNGKYGGRYRPHALGEGIRVLRDKWGWIVALGVISMIAGVIALGSVVMATESAVFIVGIMMLVVGVVEIFTPSAPAVGAAFCCGCCSAALYVFAGFICLQNPFQAAVWLT